jgi:uncharacterized hydrophobic protein (TIGR00271 family)
MLHLSVITAPDRADAVVAALLDGPGVINVVRPAGAVLAPDGERIEADVAREAADGVLERLKPLVMDTGGTVLMTEVGTALGEPAERAEQEAPGHGVDAVVWEEVAQRTATDATLSATFLVFMIAAMLIASVGLLTDSSVLIVGSMVLGPEFGPLAAIAVALVQRRYLPAWQSLRALLIGFPLGVIVTAAGVLLLRATFGIPHDYLAGHRSLTAFVSQPNVFSVVVALIAGAAGMVSVTAAKSSTLVGVFISVTTIPAAANIGTALVTDHLGEAGGAAVQLIVNLFCILFAALVTLLVQQRLWGSRRLQPRRARHPRPNDGDRAAAPRRSA